MVESLETQQQLNRLTFDDIIKEAEVRLNMGNIQGCFELMFDAFKTHIPKQDALMI